MQPLRWTSNAIAIALVLFATTSWAQTTEQSSSTRFEAPVELTANGKPMRGISYPSPTLYDLDGDSERELLIGDLRGYIRVSQPGVEETGLAWSEQEYLQSSSGKKLKLNNW